MNPDPKRRADGRCAQCGEPIKVAAKMREPHRSEARRDPFCSSECCRLWHGLEPPFLVGRGSALR
jgi:hypothetical protein